ncbi:aminoglycoside 3'-phosphotransferase [Gorillibacterium timonense]|uniref:aminoglycoside 3'-phosphotransferase n=1 Tax=Gorillibacterium timonense TaxID=1689269 RepID=UPI00071C5869|nr:aminoglycoside 3'-phosphotransferase [Gorillibacterium timonense]
MKRTKITFSTETLPSELRPFLEDADVYDSSCSASARTLFIAGKEKAFLKIACKGSLEREGVMSAHLHVHSLAPRILAYLSEGDHDYLLSEAMEGEDGTAPHHLADPDKLATVFGESLRRLHSLPTEGCPYLNRTQEMAQDDMKKGADLTPLRKHAYAPVDSVILHGDYCLPNLLMDRFELRGFIDVGDGGVGDRHYDLCSGLWTLRYNLHTDAYRDGFLDAYGREAISEEGLAYFTHWAELLPS